MPYSLQSTTEQLAALLLTGATLSDAERVQLDGMAEGLQKLVERVRAREAGVPASTVPGDLLAKAAGTRADAAARQHLAMFSGVFNAAAVGMCLVDCDGTFLRTNTCFDAMVQRAPEDIIHGASLNLVHADDRHTVATAFAQLLQGLDPAATWDMRLLRADRTTFWANTTWSVVRDGRGEPQYLIGVVIDVDDLRHAAALRRFEADLLEQVSTGQSLVQVMESAARGVQMLLPGSMASLHLLSPDGLALGDGVGPSLPADYLGALVGLPIGPNAGSCGAAAFRCQTRVTTDIDTDPNWDDYRELAQAHGLRACWSTPVLDIEGKVRATFAIYHDHPHTPLATELSLTAGVARVLGIAIDKVRREAELKASNERVRHFFEGSAVGMAVADRNGHFVEVNPAYCRMLGYSATELLGQSIQIMHPPEDWEGNKVQNIEVNQGRRANYVAARRYLGKGGRAVWVRVSVSPWKMGDGEIKGTMAVVEDITQQREAEAALRAQTELLTMASRVGRLGAWGYRLADRSVTWSDEVCAIHDRPPGYVPSAKESLAYHLPENLQTMLALTKACSEEGMPVDHETQIISHTGRPVWVRILAEAVRGDDGKIHRLQGAIQDITARKEGEARERALTDNLASTLESMNDAFFTVSGDWRFTYVNAHAEKLFNMRRDDVLSHRMSDVFPQDMGSEADLQFRMVMLERRAVQQEYFHHSLSRWVDVSAHPTGRGMAVYIRDIHARKQAEAALQHLNANLENRVRERTEDLTATNQALESFCYSISHDLRGPLRTMNGFASLLLKESGPLLPRKGAHYLQRIQRSAGKMGDLIDDLLKFAKLGRSALQVTQVDMTALTQEASEALRAEQPELTATVHIEPLPPIPGDAALLYQVWLNLIGNAFKYSSLTPGARIDIAATVQDGHTVYTVRDNGAGFDMAFADKLFGVFERLHPDNEFGGTGVGLAIVHQIIARHKGRIWADSQVGQGSTFYFTLGLEAAEP